MMFFAASRGCDGCDMVKLFELTRKRFRWRAECTHLCGVVSSGMCQLTRDDPDDTAFGTLHLAMPSRQ
eukprot:scaffold4002_cov126-Skeletonema_dohrnii-CCMP3373.AAC.3